MQQDIDGNKDKDGFLYHGHPEDGRPSLFSQMTLAKRVAWYKIYNDYLQSRWTADSKAKPREAGGQRGRKAEQNEQVDELELAQAQT
jgi:hypothetical protein